MERFRRLPAGSARPALLVLTALLACGAAYAEISPALMFSVSLEGFSSTAFPANEHLGVSASLDLDRGMPGLSFTLKALVPVNPLSLTAAKLGAGIDLTVAQWRNNPFSWVSPRHNYLTPSLGFMAYLSVDAPHEIMFAASISPLRFYSGEGYISVASLSLILDTALAGKGWAITIFEFSHTFARIGERP